MKEKVFVSVGTHPQSFVRLLKAVEALVEKKVIGPTVVQSGYTNFNSKVMKIVPFLDIEAFEVEVKKADLLITHGGEGNIGLGLQLEKPMVIVPRLQRFGEHTNDHQVELSEAVSRQFGFPLVREVSSLKDAIERARKLKSGAFSREKQIPVLLNQFVSQWAAAKKKD